MGGAILTSERSRFLLLGF